MSKTIEGRIHGDGRLVMSKAFFELTNEEYDHYLELLRSIITRLNLDEQKLINDAEPEEMRSTFWRSNRSLKLLTPTVALGQRKQLLIESLRKLKFALSINQKQH